MKRIYALLLTAAMLMTTTVSAQTQKGVVKTKGRMINGQLQPGAKLGGAVIAVRGRSAVLSQGNGNFSFPVNGQTFMLDSVRKKGYQLVDAEAAPKSYAVSKDPLYVLMETPEQQMQDKLNAERKIRRTLQRQLQEREDQIEALKESSRITEEEYRQQLQQLYQSQENNEKLIADMAKRYSEMDFDQLDSLNRFISDAILNGRLTEADSLLRTKGDINDRIAEVKRAQQAEAQEEEELARRQSNLEASKTGTRKKLEDIAEDCMNRHELCKVRLQFDSAAYYIVQRAELDTMNVKWQNDVADFFYKQNQFHQAEMFYTRVLSVLRQPIHEEHEYSKLDLANVLKDLGDLYRDTQLFDKSESMYKQALNLLQKHLPEKEFELSATLNGLASLYSDLNRFSDSEELFKRSMKTLKKLATENPKEYNYALAGVYNNLALLYDKTNRLEECEMMYNESLEIIQRLAKENPTNNDFNLAISYTNLANLFEKTERIIECGPLRQQALSIIQRLYTENPHAYEPNYAKMLLNLARYYADVENYTESEPLFTQALEIYQRLSMEYPKVYEPFIARINQSLGWIFRQTNRMSQSEDAYKITFEIFNKLIEVSEVNKNEKI